METKTIIIKGEVVRAYNGKTKFTEKIANRITLHSENLPFDEFDKVYEKSGSKLTPSWLKERSGFINVNSIYNIPIKAVNGRELSFEEWTSEYPVNGAEVTMKLTLKDGAIYPVALVVTKDGEISNPFENM